MSIDKTAQLLAVVFSRAMTVSADMGSGGILGTEFN